MRVDLSRNFSLLDDDLRRLGDDIISCPVVRVEGEAWQQCHEFSYDCWACEKPEGDYNSTYHRSPGDFRKSERCGWISEVALAKLIGKDHHWLRYKHGGDTYDIFHNGWKVDSKGGYNEYGSLYITSRYPNGNKATLWSDFYVRSLVIAENRREGWAKVAFLRYCTVDTVKICPTRLGAKKNGRPARHWVYNVRLGVMSPIAEFLETVSHVKP